MNKKVSWDQSLVKKFNSSNHFKLLNQLKSEVIKYPLTRKKNDGTRINSINKVESKNNSNTITNPNSANLNTTKVNTEKIIPKSTISFNNSKNFSIYNNNDKDISKEEKENKEIEVDQAMKDNSSLTFKDRLNNIDMK